MNDISETEKKSDILSRLVAISIAIAICIFLSLCAFSRPSVPARADAGNYVSYYLDAMAAGLPASLSGNTAFGVALGTQLMLCAIAQQVEIERVSNPGATYNFSDFQGLTGYYRLSDDDSYYPCTFVIDKKMANESLGGRYPALDGGIIVCKAAHYDVKWFPSGQVRWLAAGITSPSTPYFQVGGVTGVTQSAFDFIQTTQIFQGGAVSYTSRDITLECRFALNFNSIPTYTSSRVASDFVYPTFQNPNYSICGFPGSLPVSSPSYDVEITPETVKDIYDDYIIPSYPPEYLLFPDGFPSQEPTEPTQESTEGVTGYQPFTLPPEWLETYPMEPETFPTIPFQDVEPPTVDSDMLDGFKNGMNFWWYITKDIIDALDLEKFIALCFALVVLFFILWKLGSSGGGSGGDD